MTVVVWRIENFVEVFRGEKWVEREPDG